MSWSIICLMIVMCYGDLGDAWPTYRQHYNRVPSHEYSATDFYQREPSPRYRYVPPVSMYEPEYQPGPESYYYEPFERFQEIEDPVRQEERLAREAALPIGQETWYEGEVVEPRWRATKDDDVNAAFLQNLIIAQMARDANARAHGRINYPVLEDNNVSETDISEHNDQNDLEDEDERELKALAGKPLYHVSKTEPPKGHQNIDEPETPEYYDYPSDDSFINWNRKRSMGLKTTSTPQTTSSSSLSALHINKGQDEQFIPTQRYTYSEPSPLKQYHHKRNPTGLEALKRMLTENEQVPTEKQIFGKPRIMKRFVAPQNDLAAELRGLKRRILI